MLERGRTLDDALSSELSSGPASALEPRDKGLARLIASTVLRRKGELDAAIATFLEHALPAERGRLTPILLTAAAQLLCLGVAPHAVINIAVDQCRLDRGARRFAKLSNAVLRRMSERGPALLDELGGARADVPDWIWLRWAAHYGDDLALDIAAASLCEAALDITPKTDAADWADKLGGRLLPTGTIRLVPGPRVEELARLRRRRLVGAGRSRRVARAPARRRRRPAHRRPVRGARRQDRTARRRRRACHCRRPVGRSGSNA